MDMSTSIQPDERPFRIYTTDSIGQAIRHYRKQAGLSQAELAEQVGVDRTYLSRLEQGHGTEQLRRIIAHLAAIGRARDPATRGLVMSDRLAVWLYGDKVATIELERRRMRLRYTRQALESFPGGAPLLSLRLRVTDERYPNGAVRSFLDGLLPEGEPRRVIAEDLGLRADDTFNLARALGRDCAGALVIQPDSEKAPPAPTTLTAEPLSDDELARLVENLRSAPLGVDQRVRISLAGVQEKLLLTRLPDGRWGRPIDGTPSTHILKPEIRNYPQTVENEAFCMRVAKHLGMAVADVETITVGGRQLIVVSRYDRVVAPSGVVERVHQEDFCQATGTMPAKKYEEDGGPSLRKIAAILSEADPDSLGPTASRDPQCCDRQRRCSCEELLAAARSFRSPAPRPPVRPALNADVRRRPAGDVHRQRPPHQPRDVRPPRKRGGDVGPVADQGRGIVTDLLTRLPDAVERAARETPWVPAALLDIVTTQLETLRPV